MIANLDRAASRFFTYRDLIEAGETFARQAPDNTPQERETWDAISGLAQEILDPVVERFGRLEITYGFAGPALARLVPGRNAPELHQHAGYERNRAGNLVCKRGGQAVDFNVPNMDSRPIAAFVAQYLAFDRIYFYGQNCPIHVSIGPQHARLIYHVMRGSAGRVIPKRIQASSLMVSEPASNDTLRRFAFEYP